MALYSQRERRVARDASEADGQSLWTDVIPYEARVKIAEKWAARERFRRHTHESPERPFRVAMARILQIEAGRNYETVQPEHLRSTQDTALALDLIGALHMHLAGTGRNESAKDIEAFVNEVFEDYRVAFRMVDGEILPFESNELHKEVVEPAIGLLVGEKFEKAKTAYVNAIKEVPSDPSDAITDAGTALQETLTALGCTGNALGPLIKSAKDKELLSAHDKNLEAGIKSFMEWASADRSEKGDGHKVSDATRADAWLMIHVVGALIVRLADETPRSATP